ncbi:hypothetical protein PYW07_000216 [Mythimna separata]|uniref:Uncharacterized protein n=1 Tax=Mythimna separata TaxID=271217 RepID=A0AAD8E1M5_MYTSE|nr:hypothetical protein PYW07_000216 [Mythimna separata]
MTPTPPRRWCWKTADAKLCSIGVIAVRRFDADVSTKGVVCDRKMSPKLKGQKYKCIIRPVLQYGGECWPALGRHTQEIRVTEKKMLRWMSGVTRSDRISNSFIRGSLGVRDVWEKLQECHLRWYGHIMRRPREYVGRRCMDMAVLGAKSCGCPRKRWLGVIKSDMRANGLTGKDVEDRTKWRKFCRKADTGNGRD